MRLRSSYLQRPYCFLTEGSRPSEANAVNTLKVASGTEALERVFRLLVVFRNEPEEFQRLDWMLLQDGAVTLYFRPQMLVEDVEWLKRHDYRVNSFECGLEPVHENQILRKCIIS